MEPPLLGETSVNELNCKASVQCTPPCSSLESDSAGNSSNAKQCHPAAGADLSFVLLPAPPAPAPAATKLCNSLEPHVMRSGNGRGGTEVKMAVKALPQPLPYSQISTADEAPFNRGGKDDNYGVKFLLKS